MSRVHGFNELGLQKPGLVASRHGVKYNSICIWKYLNTFQKYLYWYLLPTTCEVFVFKYYGEVFEYIQIFLQILFKFPVSICSKCQHVDQASFVLVPAGPDKAKVLNFLLSAFPPGCFQSR